MRFQLIEEIVNFSADESIEVVQGAIDPVIGNAVLRKVVGADAITAVAAAYQGATQCILFLLLLAILRFLETRLQQTHRLVSVAMLRFFILHRNHYSRRDVGDPDSAGCLVDRLPPRS